MSKVKISLVAVMIAFFGMATFLAPEVQAQTKLEISGTDAMQYDKKELKVKAGEKVQLTLKHAGKLPKTTMGHNWVLLKKGTDLADFGTKASAARETEYIPKELEGKVIAHTKLIGGGESVTIEFTAPAKGSYDYLCSFPGHFAIMQGKLVVE